MKLFTQLRQRLGLRGRGNVWLKWRRLSVGEIKSVQVVEGVGSLQKERVLVLAAHPGEEVCGCGGVLALHVKRGDDVQVIYLTDGRRGTVSGRRDASLMPRREGEAKQALAVLGVTTLPILWQFPDHNFPVNQTSLGLLKSIWQSQAYTRIYLPGWDENDADQQAASALVAQALSETRLFEGEIWQYELASPLTPNRLVPIQAVLSLKHQAIQCHSSQLFRPWDEAMIGLNIYRGGMANLKEAAEAFLVLSADEFKSLKKLEPET